MYDKLRDKLESNAASTLEEDNVGTSDTDNK